MLGRDKEEDGAIGFSSPTPCSGQSASTGITWQTNKTTSYTPTSKVYQVTDADGKVTTNSYDDADRLLTVSDPLARKTHFQYCAPGDANCAANQVKTEYRAWSSGTGCSNGSTLQQCYRRVTYFPDGEQASIEDANNNITTYGYDDFIRLTTTTFPDSTTEQLTLDDNGNVTQRRNRAGETLSYQYNALNWMIQKTSPNPAVTDYWTYLLSGKIDTLCVAADCSSGNEIDNDYDTAGRLDHVTTRIPGLGTRGLDYTLDADGNRTELDWPQTDGGYKAGYCFDNLNRMSGASELPTDASCNTGQPLATYQYDPLSRRKEVDYANTASMAYTYTNAGDLLTLNHQMSGTGNNPHYTFTYTDAHELQTETNSDADYVWQPSTTPGTTTYAAANNLNQYPSYLPQGGLGPRTLGYDAKGNLTSGNLDGSGIWAFGYDAENRMLTACQPAVAGVCSSPTVNASYAYDPLGRRTHKSGTGVTERYFLNDGDNPVLDYDGSNVPVAFYVPGPAIDEPIVMSTPNGSGGYTHQYYHTNHQGSVIATSNDSGAKQGGPYLYDAYGNCVKGAASCASLGTVPFAFTGQRLDPETGLYYYRARMYSSQLGRFPQTDPVGYTADLNLYTYVGNNPINKTDPTGKIDGFTLEDLGFVDMGSGIVVPQSEVRGTVAAANAAPGQVARFSARMAYELSPVSSAMDIYEGGKEGDLGKISLGVVGLLPVGKAFSAEKAALREMARIDKRLGITEEDFQAYKELNSTLSDPFPEGQFHGPEAHPNAPQPTSRQEHYHAAGVSHIPARRGPDNSLQLKTCVAGISITTNQPCGK